MRISAIAILLALVGASCASEGYSQEDLDNAVSSAVAEALATTTTAQPPPQESTTTSEEPTTTSAAPTTTQASTTTSTVELDASDPRNSAVIAGNAAPPLATGEEGMLSVLQGSYETTGYGSTYVFLVVRNNTSAQVKGIEVSFTARTASGELLASGSATDLFPYRVEPDEIAFGAAFIGDIELPADAQFEFQVGSSDTDERYDDRVNLVVVEYGKPGDSVVAIIQNEHDDAVKYAQGGVMCFREDGSVTWFTDSFSDVDKIIAGDTSPVSFDLRDHDCPIYLVASKAWIDD